MEQTVSTTLTEALVACGKLKPKFPYRTIETSAIEYLGLYLKGASTFTSVYFLIPKANNPKVKPWIRENYQKKLDKFELQCQNLNALTNTVLKSRHRSKWDTFRDEATIKKVETIIQQRHDGVQL